MWGSWFGMTIGGALVLLLLIAIAFGTSALLIPVLIAIGIAIAVAVVYTLIALSGRGPIGGPKPDPVEDAAPAETPGTTSVASQRRLGAR